MSRLIEEVKRLSRKLDDIDRRVEKIEEKQPLSDGDKTPNCSAVFSWRNGTTCELTKKEDNSLTFPVEVTIKPEFKVGDRFIPHKIRYTGGSLGWTSEMDKYDGKVLSIAFIAPNGDIKSNTDKHWWFSPSWCTKVEEPYFPKKGEYFYAQFKVPYSGFISIYSDIREHYGEQKIFDKATLFLCTNNCYTGDSLLGAVKDIMNIRPATSEEKALLDSKLAEKGLIFDGKDVVKDNTPKIGDFCIFWDYDKGKAFCSILEKIINYCEGKYITRIGIGYRNCIKFESVEHFKNFLKEQ